MSDQYLIAARWANVPKHFQITGIQAAHCSRCGEKVMLSPSSARLLQESPQLDLKIVCVSCVPPASVLESDCTIAFAPGSAEEIERLERRNVSKN
jgi:DNA-directed RNA polymerase subunit RPC12/RpoP